MNMNDGGGKQALEKMEAMREEIEDANDKIIDKQAFDCKFYGRNFDKQHC